MATAAERFWAKVSKGPDDGCWRWTGATLRNGYGYFRGEQGRSVLAHRWAYEDAFGPMPSGLVTDHLCRNRSCVRPAHLEAVTQRENVLRGLNIGRPRRSTCRNGHALVAGNIDTRPGGGRRCSTCRRARENRYNAARRVGSAA